jgi:MEMO1 family protein
VSTKTGISQLGDLANALSRLDDGETIFVASVDFSHYLSKDEAEKRDAITLALLEDFNVSTLLTLNNEYMDSPKSVALLFNIMNHNGVSAFRVLRHENSGTRTKNEFSEVTSYFTLVFE